MRPHDTSPEARANQVASYRAQSGSERLIQALVLSDDVRLMALAGIAHRHPELDESACFAQLLRRLRDP